MNDAVDSGLVAVMERVTRVETLIEQSAHASQEFRAATNARMDKMAGDINAIGAKIDGIAQDIVVAKTRLQTGASILGIIGRQAPGLTIGGALAWAATHWPFK